MSTNTNAPPEAEWVEELDEMQLFRLHAAVEMLEDLGFKIIATQLGFVEDQILRVHEQHKKWAKSR